MCGRCAPLSRRRLLLGGAACATLAGCDEIPLPDLVSDDQVEAMGLRAWEDIRSQVPASRDGARARRLATVARRCLQAAGEAPGDWEVTLFASDQINAFALPGRKIGVFEGMFRAARAEDELAAIVGHEIGHLRADHAQARMNAEVAKDLGLRLIAFVLQLGDVEYAAGIAAALGMGVQYGLVLPYSRAQELEADRIGLQIAAEAAYDPAAAVALWQRMDSLAGERPPEFLSTHPAPTARIEEIRAMLPELRQG